MKKIHLLTSLILFPCLVGCGNKTPKITINNKINAIIYGQDYQLDVKAENINSSDLIYTISDEKIATISNTGLIHPLAIGPATVKVAYSKDEAINDSFDFRVTVDYIEGTVKDEDDNPIEGVHVSYGASNVVDTDENGKYLLPVDGIGNVVCYEKEGYLSYHFVPTLSQVSERYVKDVVLEKSEEGIKVSINGVLKDIHGNTITDIVTLTIYQNKGYQTTISKSDGTFSFNDVYVGENIAIGAFHSKYNLKVEIFPSADLSNISITLEPYQEELYYAVGSSPDPYIDKYKIVGHTYRIDTNNDGVTDAVSFDLNANFDAFVANNYYAICIDAGKDVPSSPNHGRLSTQSKDGNDFDITFNSTGVVEAYSYGTATLDKSKIQLNIDKDDPLRHLAVVIPYDVTNLDTFNANDTFGFYFWSAVNTPTINFECKIFGHDVTEANQLSYIRLDKDNVAYASSDNDTPDSAFIYNGERLTWESDDNYVNWNFAEHEGSTIIGQVGKNFNYGYQFKIAKRKVIGGAEADDKGIYILAKMRMSEMNGYFLENTWKPNIFIDAGVSGTTYNDPEVDTDINRFAMISNYSVVRSYPQNYQTPFYNEVGFLNEDVYGKGVRYYTNRDLAILYLPYDAIRDSNESVLTRDSSFGLALNLNYKQSEWYAFQGNNPTGYVADKKKGDHDDSSIPHFENRLSYIHFDKDLNIISFKRPQ